MNPGSLPGELAALMQAVQQLTAMLSPVLHPNVVVAMLLSDSVGVLLRMWFGFVLRTTDVETSGDFTGGATIRQFEPAMQMIADGALVLVVMWASYRIMRARCCPACSWRRSSSTSPCRCSRPWSPSATR
jgi:hypothetical protein